MEPVQAQGVGASRGVGKQASGKHIHERLCQDILTFGRFGFGLSPGWGALGVVRNVIVNIEPARWVNHLLQFLGYS